MATTQATAFKLGQQAMLRRTVRGHLGKDLIAGDLVLVEAIGEADRTPVLRRYRVRREFHWAWVYELDLADIKEALF